MKLNSLDVNWCVRRLPLCIKKLLQANPGVAVAGGYIRACVAREEVNDIDLFVSSRELGEKLAKGLTEGHSERRVSSTDNAYTVTGIKPVVQFITRWVYEQPEAVVDSFDFSVCAAAIWWVAGPALEDGKPSGAWDSKCNPAFYQDLAPKRLVYLNPIRDEAVGGSLLRVLKYYQRGYRITMPSLADVLARICGAVRDSGRTEEEGGIAAVVLGLLHEVDPNIEHPIVEANEADAT